jgi:Skp family chaperone for outer membrane proteins
LHWRISGAILRPCFDGTIHFLVAGRRQIVWRAPIPSGYGNQQRGIRNVNTAVKTLMVLILATFFASALANAQESSGAAKASAGQFKIAVVDRKVVFDSYDKQKREWEALELEKKTLQDQIDKLSNTITADKEKLENASSNLSDQQKQDLRDKIESDFRKYQTEFKRLQGEIDSKSRKFFARMMEDIDAAVKEIGVSENYHQIFEADPKSPTTVLYYSTTIDITSEVITRLNKR